MWGAEIFRGGKFHCHAFGCIAHVVCPVHGAHERPRHDPPHNLRPLLGILGLRLIVADDPITIARFGSKLEKRREEFVHAGTVNIVLTRRHLRAIQKKGGRNSRLYMSKRKASALARKAVKARWAKRKQNGSGRRPGRIYLRLSAKCEPFDADGAL